MTQTFIANAATATDDVQIKLCRESSLGTEGPRKDSRSSKQVQLWVVVWFALLMTATIAVRVVDPVGWLGSDDASYHSAAEHVLTEQTFQRVHHHYARSPIVIAVAGSMWLFGESPAMLALPMLIASVLCIALVAILGRLLWGWWEGLCAATVLSFIPVFQNTSTCVLPGAHVCLWATVAIVLTVVAARMRRSTGVWVCAAACGFTLGLATSAKVFGAFAGIGVLVIMWTRTSVPRRERLAWLGCVALGVVAFFMLEGVFYLWAADDFWYKLHAIRNTQIGVEAGELVAGELVAGETVGPASSRSAYATEFIWLAWGRLTMPFRTAQSGWGRIGMVFWPATLAVLLLDRRGRGIAAWAIATYLLVAFAPISLKNGPRLFPWFDGRNILIVCVPFALCFAWGLHRLAGFALRCTARAGHKWHWCPRGSPAAIRWSWPLLLMAIIIVSGIDRAGLNRSLNFRQQDLARAIERLVATTDWDDHRPIFMAPSLYRRYRILFPSSLRPRLRVAADENAPTWWRYATVDMTTRWKPLPPPGEAYLAATPEQLNGQCHLWDYGVGLPHEGLEAWRRTSPVVSVSRSKNGTIDISKAGTDDGEEILVLLSSDAPPARALTRRPL